MGLKVKEFMFGLPGPRIFSFKWGETEYGATMVPFGGYVKFAGVESELQLEEDDEDKDTPPERKYDTQPRWRKAIIMFAGPLMNMVLPVIIFAIILMAQGIPHASNSNVLGEVVAKSPAQEAGLKEGDRIISIDGNRVKTWEEVVNNLKDKPEEKVTIVVSRDGKEITVEPTLDKREGRGFLGISPEIEYKRMPPHTALYNGVLATYGVIKLMIVTLYNVIAHRPEVLVKDSAGPVGIIYESAKIVQQSIWRYLEILAFISVNIGIINLLPIPPLDGGRLAILGVEGIIRKQINKKAVLAVNAVGMALLLTLMVYFVFADFNKIFRGIPFIGGG